MSWNASSLKAVMCDRGDVNICNQPQIHRGRCWCFQGLSPWFQQPGVVWNPHFLFQPSQKSQRGWLQQNIHNIRARECKSRLKRDASSHLFWCLFRNVQVLGRYWQVFFFNLGGLQVVSTPHWVRSEHRRAEELCCSGMVCSWGRRKATLGRLTMQQPKGRSCMNPKSISLCSLDALLIMSSVYHDSQHREKHLEYSSFLLTLAEWFVIEESKTLLGILVP